MLHSISMKLITLLSLCYNGAVLAIENDAVINLRGGGGQGAPSAEPFAHLRPNHFVRHVGRTQSMLRKLAANCNELGCSSSYLIDQSSVLDDLLTTVDEKLSPLTDFFNDMLDVQTTVGQAAMLRSTLETAAGIAKAVPGLGVFGSVESTLKTFKPLISTFKSGIDKASNLIIKPYDKSIGEILDKLDGATEKLTDVLENVGGLSDILEGKCVKDIFSTLAPGFNSVVSTVSDLVVDLADTVQLLLAAMSNLVAAIEGNAWKNIESVLKQLNQAAKVAFKPFDAMSPISSLLDKQITVSFPGSLTDKSCPSGTDNIGGVCYKKCDSGWSTTATFSCTRDCPDYRPVKAAWEQKGAEIDGSFYRDIGWACENYYEVKAWFPFAGTCGGKKYAKVGGACVKKCSSTKRKKLDFKTQMAIGFGVCRAPCPSGFQVDPTGMFCLKATKARSSSLPKCTNGAIDGGLFCFKMSQKNFKISSLADTVKKLKEDFEGLPVINEVTGAMETATKKVFSFILSIVEDVLDIEVPSVSGSLFDNPPLNFNGIAGEIDALVNVNVPGSEVFDFADEFLNKISSSFGVSDLAGLTDCEEDVACLAGKLGLDMPDISEIKDLLPNFDANLDFLDPLVDMLANIVGCKEQTTISLCPSNLAANLLGQSQTSDCDIPIEVCTAFDVDESLLVGAEDAVERAVDPIQDLFETIFDSYGRRRLGAGHSNGDYEQDVFPIPIGMLFLPTFRKTDGRTVISWKFAKAIGKDWEVKESTEIVSRGVTVDMRNTAMVISYGRKDGQRYKRLRFQNGLSLTLEKFNDDMFAVISQLLLNVREAADEMSMLCTGADPAVRCSLRNQRAGCADICDVRDKLADSSSWEWGGPSNPNQYMLDHPRGHESWETAAGKEIGASLVDVLKKMQKKLDKGKKAYYKNMSWKSSWWVDKPFEGVKAGGIDAVVAQAGTMAQYFLHQALGILKYNFELPPSDSYGVFGFEMELFWPWWDSYLNKQVPQKPLGGKFGAEKFFKFDETPKPSISSVYGQVVLPQGFAAYRKTKGETSKPLFKSHFHFYVNANVHKWDEKNGKCIPSKEKAIELIGKHQSGTYDNAEYGRFRKWTFCPEVKSLSGLFASFPAFNGDVSSWDVSKVEDMSDMFSGASSFNQALSTWDVGNVVNMENMFRDCSSFDQDLSSWDTSSVQNMKAMFFLAESFNSHVGDWDVGNVRDFSQMFHATPFNQPIGQWDTSSATSLNSMFDHAAAFNQPIGQWDVANVSNFHQLFRSAHAFNQDISQWDVSAAKSMDRMFIDARSFNQDIGGWNTSSVRQTQGMFNNADSFDQDISGWDLSNLVNMVNMFAWADKFNQNLCNYLQYVDNDMMLTAKYKHWDFSECS